MSGDDVRRRRPWWSSRWIAVPIVVVFGLWLGLALISPKPPRPVAAFATLDQCYWGWPVVAFEGEDWTRALPDKILAHHAPGYIPVAEWPDGLHFDEPSGTLLDASGDAVFRNGDRMRITGAVIEVHGDPSPCFYTLGVRVDEIAAP